MQFPIYSFHLRPVAGKSAFCVLVLLFFKISMHIAVWSPMYYSCLDGMAPCSSKFKNPFFYFLKLNRPGCVTSGREPRCFFRDEGHFAQAQVIPIVQLQLIALN